MYILYLHSFLNNRPSTSTLTYTIRASSAVITYSISILSSPFLPYQTSAFTAQIILNEQRLSNKCNSA